METTVSAPNSRPATKLNALLASPRAEKRIDSLLSADDAADQVAALLVTDLHFLIEQVGLADCVELISLCTNEQIQGCIDMEIWDRDRPQLVAILPWLAAIQENGFEFLGRVWEGLDSELTALILASFCEIYDKSLDEYVPDEEERDYFETLDTFFQIVIATDDAVQHKLIHSLIEDLYRADMVLARHTLMSARSEPKAELEEMSYRWQAGRMADLGYVDFYDALEIFRPIDPQSIVIGESTANTLDNTFIFSESPIATSLPTPLLESLAGRQFLVQALHKIDDPQDNENLQSAILYMVNQVMSAGRLPPGQEDALRVAALHATATVALGLEYITRGSIEKAKEALLSISMTRLHRLGYTLCRRLASVARVIAPRASKTGETAIVVLDALLALRPWYPLILDDPASRGERAIESLSDLHTIADFLKTLALRIAVADALGDDASNRLQSPENENETDDYIRTALVHSYLGNAISARALQPEELCTFRDRVSLGLTARQRHKAYSDLTELLDSRGVVEANDSLEALVNQWSNELEEEFKALPAEQEIDTKFLGLIITSGTTR